MSNAGGIEMEPTASHPLPIRGIRVAVAGLFATVLLIVGCGTEGSDPGAETTQVARFIQLVGRGTDVDYEPLQSPADALAQAELIVDGSLVDVIDGVQFHYDDEARTQRHANSYATFVIAVEKIVSGDEALVVSGRVYVQVMRSALVSLDDLRRQIPSGARVAAVLHDWATHPARAGRMVTPEGIPVGAPTFSPHPDGIWLEDDSDGQMYGIFADPQHLREPWGGVSTIDAYLAAIDAAKPS